MKKIIFLLTLILTISASALCLAADGGDLNKEQKSAEKIIDLIDGAPVPTYEELTPLFSKELLQKFTPEEYAQYPKNVKNAVGDLQEVHFVSFERFNNGDRLMYRAKFAKEPDAVFVITFNKQYKIWDFALKALRQQEPPQEKK